MSLGYRWVLDQDAYDFLRRLPGARRSRLERMISNLAAHPFTEPDFIAFDDEGCELFHLFSPDHVIVYHVDHAVRRELIQEIYLVS